MERHPLNAQGPFYVVRGACMTCLAPEDCAPSLMGFVKDPDGPATSSCYFKLQPATPEETRAAVDAVVAQCCGALRYGGNDPGILERLPALQCDTTSGGQP